MTRMTIDMGLMRGAVVALVAASAARVAPAQVVPVPARQTVKDTTVVLRMIDGTRIQADSIRVLLRAFEGEPLSSMQSEKMRRELDAMAIAFKSALGLAGGQRIIISGPDGIRQFGMLPAKGWIGLTTAGVHNDWDSDGHFVQYLDYPPIVSVDRRSPAQLAGILPGDTLVAYDGVDVVAHPINVTQLLTPERRLAVTVRRDGESKAFSLVVSRVPNTVFTRRLEPGDFPGFGEPVKNLPGDPDGVVAGPGRIAINMRGGRGGPFFVMTSDGVFGASLSPVPVELARTLKIEPGVLVNEVPDGTPASRCGLRAGDVIVSVEGQGVSSVDDVRKLAARHGESGVIKLQVMREHKVRAIIVK